MRKRTPKPYFGNASFKSIGEVDPGTNEEHVQALVSELPYIRLATHLLSLSDVQLEEKVRAIDGEGVTEMMNFGTTLGKIAERWKAGAAVCDSALARIMVVLDRCAAGPRPAAWALDEVAK